MADLNVVTLTGRLTKAPEGRDVKVKGESTRVARFTLAVSKVGKDAGASFLNIVAWRGLATLVENYLDKGSRVGVTARVDQRSWQNDDGDWNNVVEFVAQDIVFLSPKGETQQQPQQEGLPFYEEDEDDVPF